MKITTDYATTLCIQIMCVHCLFPIRNLFTVGIISCVGCVVFRLTTTTKRVCACVIRTQTCQQHGAAALSVAMFSRLCVWNSVSIPPKIIHLPLCGVPRETKYVCTYISYRMGSCEKCMYTKCYAGHKHAHTHIKCVHIKRDTNTLNTYNSTRAHCGMRM